MAGQVRHIGPVTVSPTVWLVTGHRLTELSEAEQADPAAGCRPVTDGAVIIVGEA